MLTKPESIADHYRFALDVLSNGVDLEPRKIAQILTQQAAAIVGDLEIEDARELHEALATIADRLNPTEPAPF